MTPDEHHQLGAYTRFLADEIGLRDWTVYVDIGPVHDSEHVAEVQRIYGRKHARIRVADDWGTHAPETQRQSLVHELVHLHVAGMQDAAAVLSEARGISGQTYQVWRTLFNHQVEFAVDAMADALAPYLPLPPALEDAA